MAGEIIHIFTPVANKLRPAWASRGARRKGKALSQTAANPSRRVFEQAEQLPTQIANGVGRVAVGDGRAAASGGQAFALF